MEIKCKQTASTVEGTTIDFSSECDALGRRQFSLQWSDPLGKKRSQVFFANPYQYGFNNEGLRLGTN